MSVQPQLFEQQGACVRLVAQYRNARQPVRRLTNVLTLLGRGDGCDIILSSNSVGIAHAAIVRLGTTAYICDLGAPGGTQIDGRYVRWSRLHDGAELVLGRFKYRIELEGGDLAVGTQAPTFALLRDGDRVAATSEDPLLVIGSGEGCDVQTTDAGVASRHALIVWSQHGPIIRDLSSQSGTRHNGRTVTIARLLSGDTIGVGGLELKFKIDMAPGIENRIGGAQSEGDMTGAAGVAPLVAGRLDAAVAPKIEDLWPNSQPRLNEKNLQAETKRDLSLLNEAARNLAESHARLESSFDASALLMGLEPAPTSMIETGSGILGEQVAMMAGVTVSASASVTGDAKGDDRSAERGKDVLLESTQRLQNRRDQDKRRFNKPSSPEIGADMAAAPPVGRDAGGGDYVETPEWMPAHGASGGTPARNDADDTISAAMWQKTAARLELELTESREELKRAKAKLAQHLELHGSLEARNRKIDQRLNELRARVAGAQEAMDERARSLRVSLDAERDRLRQQHLDIQRKNEELEQVAARQREEVQQAFNAERDQLEKARADLLAERETLSGLRAEFESEVALARADQQRILDDLHAANQKRMAELDERQRAIEQAAAEDAERREAAFAWRENELAERRRALELEHESHSRLIEVELAERRKVLEQEHESRFRQVEMELVERRTALEREKEAQARAREQQSLEARREFEAWQHDVREELEIERRKLQDDIAAQRAELDAARADHTRELESLKLAAEREVETANRLRIDELNRKEAQIAEREEALELRKRRATEVVEENRKRDEEQVAARMRALEEAFAARVQEHDAAFRARAEALEVDSARRQSEIDSNYTDREARIAEQDRALAERRRELEQTAAAQERERQLEFAAQREALQNEFAAMQLALHQEFAARQQALQEEQADQREAMQREFDELDKRRQEEVSQREAVLDERRIAARSLIEKQLSDRDAEFARREEELAARERAIEARLAEVDQSAAQRERELNEKLAQINQVAAQREAEFTDRLALIDKSAAERERELSTRIAEVDRQLANRKRELEEQAAAELKRKREELDRTINDRLANAELDLAARDSEHQSRVDAVTQRESELERVAEHLRIRAADVEQRETGLAVREQDLLARFDAHASTESEVTQLAAALETRNTRLVEWQARLESDAAALEAHREEAEKARGAILVRQQEIDQRSAELEARFAELMSGRSGLKSERELLAGRSTEIEAREAQLRKREEQLERSREELAEEARRVAEAREETRELDRKIKLLDERSSELGALSDVLASRELLLSERVTAHEQHLEEVEQHRRELETMRSQLDAERRELEVRAHSLDERMARAEAFEQRVRQGREELENDRKVLAADQAAQATAASAFESQTRSLAERVAQLETEQHVVRVAQEQLAERERALAREKLELTAAAEKVAADRSSLELFKSHVDEQQIAFARRQAEFAARVSEFEAERSRLEREKLINRDQGRELSTERSSVESAQAEIERLQAELKTGIDENHLIRRQLMETRDRLRSRKRRLIDDVAALDLRTKQLEQEIDRTRKLRTAVDADREALADEQRLFANERDGFKVEKEHLDQAKRTYQAGVRDVESREKVVTERELELAEHARKLEEYRARLEEEYTDIEKQRQDLLNAQVSGSEEAQRVSVLMEQTDSMRAELRGREEELAALEKATLARAAELTVAEEAVRRKAQDFDDSLSRIEAGRRQLEEERKAFNEAMENERDDAMTARRQAEAQIAEQRAALERRMREFEAEVSAQRAALEAEEHATHEAALSEVRQRVEAELSDRLDAARQREEEVEKRARQRLEEVERDIQERLARFEDEIRRRRELAEQDSTTRQASVSEETRAAQAHWDSQLEELRQRQASISAEYARLRSEREIFEAEQRDFEARRQFVAMEREPAIDADVDEAARIAVLESRQRDLDDREQALNARAAELDEASAEMRMLASAAVGVATVEQDDIIPSKSMPITAAHSAPAISRPLPLRHRLVGLPLVLASIMGIACGAVIYGMLPPKPTLVTAAVQFKADAPASMVRMQDHREAILRSIADAKTKGNLDLAKLPEAGGVDINADDTNRRLTLAVAASNATLPLAESWLKAIGAAYTSELDAGAKSQAEVSRRLSELAGQREARRRELESARETLREYQIALDADPQAREVERTQVELKREVDAATAAVAAAQKALEEAQAKPLTDAPITPSEAERNAVYKGDVQLSQKMDQRAVFARNLHGQLVNCLNAVTAPLSNYEKSIDEFRKQIDARRKEQRDRDILTQLEQIAVGTSDLRDQLRAFSSELGELTPKIRKWNGGDVVLLMEYQRAAEDLILKLDNDSRATWKEISGQIDEFNQGGSEPTQRSVIYRSLRKVAALSSEAFLGMTNQLAAIVTGNNKNILTLRRSIRDLSEGIAQKQAVHDEALLKHLTAIREDQYKTRINKLREDRDAAQKRKDAANSAFQKRIEEAIANDKAATDRIAALRKTRDEQDEKVRKLDQELQALDAEATSIRKDGRTDLARVAEFQVEPATRLASVDRNRVLKAAGVGGAVTIMFLAFAALAVPGRRQ